MRISDWSSDVCSSDLDPRQHEPRRLLTGAEGLMRIIAAAEVEAALDYPSLVERLRQAFRRDIQVPVRHHHEVEVTDGSTATLLLMPAWQVGRHIGVKMVTVFPDNAEMSLPAVLGIYENGRASVRARVGEYGQNRGVAVSLK